MFIYKIFTLHMNVYFYIAIWTIILIFHKRLFPFFGIILPPRHSLAVINFIFFLAQSNLIVDELN